MMRYLSRLRRLEFASSIVPAGRRRKGRIRPKSVARDIHRLIWQLPQRIVNQFVAFADDHPPQFDIFVTCSFWAWMTTVIWS